MKIHHLLHRIRRKSISSPCRHRVVAVGLNSHGTAIAIKSNSRRFMSRGGGWHAEELVIHSSPRSLQIILIARISRSGKFLPIDPCPKCLRLAAKRGITIRPIVI